MTDQEKLDILDKHVRELGEFFDTVQIFVMNHASEENPDTDDTYSAGAGNFYARQAQVREWSLMQDERARIHVRKEEEDS